MNFCLILYRASALCFYHSKKRVHEEQLCFDLSLFQPLCLLKGVFAPLREPLVAIFKETRAVTSPKDMVKKGMAMSKA